MKNVLLIILVSLISGCSSSLELISKLDHHFFSDFSSENNRLSGDLYLDVFNDDLSKLSYDYYLTYITKHEAPSAKGFVKMVKNADYHFFKASKEFFVIALYYKNDNIIICDNSNTSFLDSLQVYKNIEEVPELSEFVKGFLE